MHSGRRSSTKISVFLVGHRTTATPESLESAKVVPLEQQITVTMTGIGDPYEFALIVSDLEGVQIRANWIRTTQRVLLFGESRFIALRAVAFDPDLGHMAMIDHGGWTYLSRDTTLAELSSLYLAPRNWALLETVPVATEGSGAEGHVDVGIRANQGTV